MEQVVFNADGTYVIIERYDVGNYYLVSQEISDIDNPDFVGTFLEQRTQKGQKDDKARN